MDDDVPLIVPEVNPEAIDLVRRKNIVANPNCSTAWGWWWPTWPSSPVHDQASGAATYQSVSGAGRKGMDELCEPDQAGLRARSSAGFLRETDRGLQRHPGDRRGARGWLHRRGSQDVERDPQDPRCPAIALTVTCVRVPSATLARTSNPNFAQRRGARGAMRSGILVVDKEGRLRDPAGIQGEFPVYVSRVREDWTIANGLSPGGGRQPAGRRGPGTRSTCCMIAA